MLIVFGIIIAMGIGLSAIKNKWGIAVAIAVFVIFCIISAIAES